MDLVASLAFDAWDGVVQLTDDAHVSGVLAR